jgi:dTDP-4-dehydrorhamnose 3,5-epimerase-like enzyme
VVLSKCRLIELPRVEDRRGNLTFIEEKRHVPFEIKRVYYLYDVPGGEARGGHAHKKLQQFIIAANGSFDIVLDEGLSKERYHMNRSYYGLYIPSGVWRELDNFSSGSVCLVLASEYFDEEDYIRDYNVFKKYAQTHQDGLDEYSKASVTLEKVVTISPRR